MLRAGLVILTTVALAALALVATVVYLVFH